MNTYGYSEATLRRKAAKRGISTDAYVERMKDSRRARRARKAEERAAALANKSQRA